MVTPPLVTVELMSEGKLGHVTVSAHAPVVVRQSNAESAIAAMFIFLLVIFLVSCVLFVFMPLGTNGLWLRRGSLRRGFGAGVGFLLPLELRRDELVFLDKRVNLADRGGCGARMRRPVECAGKPFRLRVGRYAAIFFFWGGGASPCEKPRQNAWAKPQRPRWRAKERRRSWLWFSLRVLYQKFSALCCGCLSPPCTTPPTIT